MSNQTLLKPLTVIIVCVSLLCGACGKLPEKPSYPYHGSYGSREAVIAEAERMSYALEKHIKDWMDGRASAQIPDELLPVGRKPWMTNFRLMRPEEAGQIKQWIVREEIKKIDWNATPGLFGDPHVTYMVLTNLFVPTGTKVHIEGDFPHSRYFSLQVTPSFEPNK